MKKIIYVFATVLCLGLITFVTYNKAYADQTIPTNYYAARPSENGKLQVHTNHNFQLGKPDNNSNLFEFFYIHSKDAYVINDQFAFQSVSWNGKFGVGNLIWRNQSFSDESLWLIEKLSDNKVIIHNKKKTNMVWTINNSSPIIGDRVSLKDKSNSTSQIFNLVSPR